MSSFSNHPVCVVARLIRNSPFTADARCMVRVDSNTQVTSLATWYDIWEAVNAISYMCVRQKDKGGTASKVGR